MNTIRFYGASWCNACPGQWAVWSTHCEELGLPIEYVDVDEKTDEAMNDNVIALPTIIAEKNRYGSLSRETIIKIIKAMHILEETKK